MYAVILFVFFAFAIRHFNKHRKPPILGIYQQGNTFFYFKYAFMLIILMFKQIISRSKQKRLNEKLQTKTDHDLEGPKALQNHSLAIDAVYFNGTSNAGSALICGVARRPNRICNAFIYLQIAGSELLLSPTLPDTTLEQTAEEEKYYHVAGLKIDMIKPMETWRIQYEGTMKLSSDPTKSVEVKLDANWNRTDWNHFNYDTDMSPSSMARDIARELWSREYFQTLNKVHQTHYEQYGTIKGHVTINGKEHNINVDSVRDHTHGKYRDWKNFHRYGLHFLTLSNGDHITVGKICMPICFSNLTVGFLCKRNSNQIYPINYCNLELYQHGENSQPPLDYAFQFEAGETIYTVQVNVTDSPTFYIGQEQECRIVERLAKFTVNGVDGWGAAEWQYRNVNDTVL